MTINWNALLQVVVVSLVVGIGVVVIAAVAARMLDAAHTGRAIGLRGGIARISAYVLFALIGAIVLFGLWLMVPYFH